MSLDLWPWPAPTLERSRSHPLARNWSGSLQNAPLYRDPGAEDALKTESICVVLQASSISMDQPSLRNPCWA
jgi:hypothetical protein